MPTVIALSSLNRDNSADVLSNLPFQNSYRSQLQACETDGYDNTDPLNEFDRAVLSVCISEMEAGNHFTTPAIILRALTGKVGTTSINGQPVNDVIYFLDEYYILRRILTRVFFS